MSALGNIRSLGFQPKVQRISVTKERIEDVTLSVFNPPDRLLLCVRKVIYADEVPIVYESSFVPTNMSDKIVDEFGKRFIIDALKRYKVAVKEMSFIIDAAPASQEAQRVFSVPNSYPTLRRLYNLKTSAPTMSIVGIIESPFDRLACSVRPGSGRISKMNKKK
ncbi:hypothetical protein LMG24235_08539 [Paraburkholderia sabiae]|nr:hypothetical protein LMG24235_08539 [Paraburkholderia sabiae]